MPSHLVPALARERTAARLLDMEPVEFRRLVHAGLLPKGREIAPGVERWSVAELADVGKAADRGGFSSIDWSR